MKEKVKKKERTSRLLRFTKNTRSSSSPIFFSKIILIKKVDLLREHHLSREADLRCRPMPSQTFYLRKRNGIFYQRARLDIVVK